MTYTYTVPIYLHATKLEIDDFLAVINVYIGTSHPVHLVNRLKLPRSVYLYGHIFDIILSLKT